jgi:large subunit ribosomal protein L19
VSVLDDIVADQIRTDLPPLAPGDTVKVSAKVVEGNRERIQVFEGTVMRLTGGGITRSVTVRALRSGVGVERTFKVNSPRIDHIEVVRHGVARRAKLYFLRDRVGKAASLRERRARGAHAAAMEEHKAVSAASAPAKAAKVEKKRPEKQGPVMGGKKGSKRA